MLTKSKIKGVKHIIVVASGKGGVGKSTVSANLAIMLAKKGYKTALLDADVYGPSIPKMFDLEDQMVEVTMGEDGKEYMKPLEKYGVKINSIGFLVPSDKAVIWRGPLAGGALAQLFTQTVWGDIDYMIVDFPPGTGDVQISAIQQFKIAGAIIVTTPQVIAVNDARKGAEMFAPNNMNVPLFGVVENMAWFTPKQHPEEKYFLFGQGGGLTLAREFNTTLLAQIPLVQEVGEAAEKGGNLMDQDNALINQAFESLADEVVYQLENAPIEEVEHEHEDCDRKNCDHSDSCTHDCSTCGHACHH